MTTQPEWISRAFTTAAHHFQAGLHDQAREILIRTLECEPRHADSLYLLASIVAQSGDLDLGESLLRQAIAIEANKTPYWVLLGNVLQQRGQWDNSGTCYQTALAVDPRCADACYNWGNTFEKQGRSREATECFERTLDLLPDHVQARNNLANQYRQAGRLAEAASHLEQARTQEPRSMPVVLNLGNVYMAQSRHEDAVACFEAAIALAPDIAVVYNNKGNALRALGRIEEAIECYHQAIELDPTRAEFFVNCGVALQSQGRLRDALATFRGALALAPDNAAAHGAVLFTLHYDPSVDNLRLLEAHRDWARRHTAPLDPGPRKFNRSLDPERPLRIGYVSPDFRQHPVAFFTAPVIEAHTFERVCYFTGSKPDLWTARLRKSATLWRDVPGLSDIEIAELIERDAVDILIDLSGHTAENRLTVFARRPAPVAVTWLGYFNTTGMEAMDYIALDNVIAPSGEAPPYVEATLHIDGCYLSYAGPDYAPEVAPLPALARGYITYGCFNTLSKITEEVVRGWARLLHRDPDARLVLKNSALNDALSRRLYRDLFVREGIAAERVDLLGPSPHPELLAQYSEVDIALDPFPYNGGTTTCEALWMGVPVVTCAGDRFVSRVGASILTHAGHPEWIASSPDEYIEMALALGAGRNRLSATRADLRRQIQHSTLGDTAGFTRRWEDALRMVWRRYCATAR